MQISTRHYICICVVQLCCFVFQTTSRSINAAETVIRRTRQGPRLPANRHSFFGFESSSIVAGHDLIQDSPPTKYNLPDSVLLNANNLASTPASKVLHPLLEDESPISPSKVSKSLFLDTGADEEQNDLINNDTDDTVVVEKADDNDQDQLTVNGKHDKSEMDPTVNDSGENLPESSFPIKIGDKIELGGGESGQVQYVGETKFADGVWVGLELKNPKGKLKRPKLM